MISVLFSLKDRSIFKKIRKQFLKFLCIPFMFCFVLFCVALWWLHYKMSAFKMQFFPQLLPHFCISALYDYELSS